MENTENCIFCKIVKGEVPSTKVYENEHVLGFLDIAPVNIGHSLVIPKQHYENIYEAPEEIMCEMMKAAKKIAIAVKALPSDGVNVTMNNDKHAGQVIFHAHIHIIPRYKEDSFGLWKGNRNYNEGEKDETAKKIIAKL